MLLMAPAEKLVPELIQNNIRLQQDSFQPLQTQSTLSGCFRCGHYSKTTQKTDLQSHHYLSIRSTDNLKHLANYRFVTYNYDKQSCNGLSYDGLSGEELAQHLCSKQAFADFGLGLWLCEKSQTTVAYSNCLLFTSRVPSGFQRMIPIHTEFFHCNHLPTVSNADYLLEYGDASNNYLLRNIPPTFVNGTCNCVVSSLCQQALRIGLVIGCLPIDGLQISTLKCFFSSNCLNTIIQHLDYYTQLDGPRLQKARRTTIQPFSSNQNISLQINPQELRFRFVFSTSLSLDSTINQISFQSN